MSGSIGEFFQNNLVQFVLLIVTCAAIVFVGLSGLLSLQVRWLLILAIMAGFAMIVGFTRTTTLNEDGSVKELGRWDGIFIDGRKKISLSYLQIILWTFVIFSAFAAIVLHRMIPVLENSQPRIDWNNLPAEKVIAPGSESIEEKEIAFLIELLTGAGADEVGGRYDALAVEIPPELWVLLGISTVSLVGAGLIKVNKANTETSVSIKAFEDERRKVEESVKELEDLKKALARSNRTEEDAATADAVLLKIISEEGQLDMQFQEATKKLDRLENMQPVDPIEVTKARDALDKATVHLSDKTQQKKRASSGLSRINEESAAVTNTIEALEISLQNKGILTTTYSEEELDEKLKAEQQKKQSLELEQSQKEGSLQINENIKYAKWSDIFSRELIGASQLTDLGKIQMFFLTIILVLTYSSFLWAAMSNPLSEKAIQMLPSVSLPAITESMLVLLGISHAGYLAVKGTG